MNVPLWSSFVPHKICHSKARSHTQVHINQFVLTAQLFWCQMPDFVILTREESHWSRSTKFLLGPTSWEAHYKQADNTGWASSSAFHTVALSPSWDDSTMSAYSFSSGFINSQGKPSITASSLLLHCFNSTHPTPTMWAKAQKTIISQAKAGTVFWTVIILLVTGSKNTQATNTSNQCNCKLSHWNDILTLVQYSVQLYP